MDDCAANARAVWGSTLASAAVAEVQVSVVRPGKGQGIARNQIALAFAARASCKARAVHRRSSSLRELAGELHRRAQAAAREERSEHALPIELLAFVSGRSRPLQSARLPALAVRRPRGARPPLRSRRNRDLLEEFRQLSRDHEDALGPSAADMSSTHSTTRCGAS